MRFPFQRTVACLSIAAFVLTGCSAHHIALAPGAAEKIKTVRLISIIPQAVVAGTVNPSAGEMATLGAGMLFGVIGMAASYVIYGGMITAREHLVAGKLASLVEPQKRFDIRQEFLDKLRMAAEGSNRFAIQSAETVTKGDGSKERARALKEMPEDGVLTVFTQYYLSPDFKMFNVASNAELWQKGKKKVFLGQWIYHSTPLDGESEGEIIDAWGKNDGEALIAVAHEAIDRITQMMRIDLLGEATDPGHLKTASLSYSRPPDGRGMHLEGLVLVRQDGWAVVRTDDGTLHAVPCLDTLPPDWQPNFPDPLCVMANEN